MVSSLKPKLNTDTFRMPLKSYLRTTKILVVENKLKSKIKCIMVITNKIVI